MFPCQFVVYVFCTIAFFPTFTNSEPKRIVCYIGTDCALRRGRGAFHLNDLDASLCTHVILGFPRLKDENTINLLTSWVDFMKDTNISIVKQKFSNVTFLASLGGWYNGVKVFTKSAESPEGRRVLAQTALDFVRKNDFDGLELSWLYPTKRGGFLSERKNFVELLKDFKIKFEENNLTFTVLIGGSYTTIDTGYNVKEIFKIVDFVDIISYDYNGVWSTFIAPNAPLYSNDKLNVNYTVQHLIELGANREKITIGIPFYGRILFACDGNENPKLGDLVDKNQERLRSFMGPYSKDEAGLMAYNELCLELLKSDQWKKYWDDNSQTPYLVTNDKLITYENMTSVDMKVKYAFKEGLGGVMIFSVDQDDFRGDCPNESPSLNRPGYKNYPMLRYINEIFKSYAERFENDSQTQHEDVSNHKIRLNVPNVIYFCSLCLLICIN